MKGKGSNSEAQRLEVLGGPFSLMVLYQLIPLLREYWKLGNPQVIYCDFLIFLIM